MTLLEAIAAILGIANIILLRKRSVWNFPFGIASVSIFFWIYWQSGLHSVAGLQIFFILVQLYGWWAWSRQIRDENSIHLKRLTFPAQVSWIMISLVATAVWSWWMEANTLGSIPMWDATIAMLSVVGQVLMAQRYVENWHWWIVVNIISIPVYISTGIYITAALYGIYLVLAIAGLIEWKKALSAK